MRQSKAITGKLFGIAKRKAKKEKNPGRDFIRPQEIILGFSLLVPRAHLPKQFFRTEDGTSRQGRPDTGTEQKFIFALTFVP